MPAALQKVYYGPPKYYAHFERRWQINLENPCVSFVQIFSFARLHSRSTYHFQPGICAEQRNTSSGDIHSRPGSPEHDGPVGHQGAAPRTKRG